MASNCPTLTITEELPRTWWRAAAKIKADKSPDSYPDGESASQNEKAIWLVARRGSRIVGTCRGELATSATAAVFPPDLVVGEPPATGRLLLETLVEKLASNRPPIRLLHALTDFDQAADAEVLKSTGFKVLGDVLHMSCRSDIQALPGNPRLEWEPFIESPANWNRLKNVYKQTCVGTRDFPELDLLGGMESLEGYRSAGHFHEELWQFVRLEGHDIGCLLMSELSEPEVCQLVYCGLIPNVRSRGLGKELASLARRLAATHGAKHVILSVDKRNRPAIRAYETAGFLVTDQQLLFVKQRAQQSR